MGVVSGSEFCGANETGVTRFVARCRRVAVTSRRPVLIMCRGSSRWQGSPLITRGAGKLHNRPRALAVRWGHEPLVGCRANGALPLGSVRVPDPAWSRDQIPTSDGRNRILRVCGIDWAEAHVRHEASEVERR